MNTFIIMIVGSHLSSLWHLRRNSDLESPARLAGHRESGHCPISGWGSGPGWQRCNSAQPRLPCYHLPVCPDAWVDQCQQSRAFPTRKRRLHNLQPSITVSYVATTVCRPDRQTLPQPPRRKTLMALAEVESLERKDKRVRTTKASPT